MIKMFLWRTAPNVGADAHIGPLGDARKVARVDRGIRPYKSYRTP